MIAGLLCCAESFVLSGFGLTFQRQNSHLLRASRCGVYKELYWKLKEDFNNLRDKAKRRPRELDYECFAKWDDLKEKPKEEVEQLWLKSVDDFQTPASFRQFLLICDDLGVDKEYEDYLEENFVEYDLEEEDW